MNPRLALARVWLPAAVRKRKLAALVRLTARAFGTPAPDLDGLSLAAMGRRYAEFTRTAADRAQADPAGLPALERRLYDGAVELGSEVRRELRVVSRREVMAAARLLYRGLEIDLRGGPEGDIVINRCSFSSFYSPETCRLMSRLDAGVLAGLAGGGRLEFAERLTEGRGRCRARFFFPEGAA